MNSDFCVAVHAAVFLYHKQAVCSSEQLAENICTHPARVRRVLVKLKSAGLIDTAGSGPKSGYIFSGDAGSVTLADIAAALQIKFIEPGWRSGSTDMDCLIATGMANLMDEVFDDLNTRCYSRLSSITIKHLNDRIFG